MEKQPKRTAADESSLACMMLGGRQKVWNKRYFTKKDISIQNLYLARYEKNKLTNLVSFV